MARLIVRLRTIRAWASSWLSGQLRAPESGLPPLRPDAARRFRPPADRPWSHCRSGLRGQGRSRLQRRRRRSRQARGRRACACRACAPPPRSMLAARPATLPKPRAWAGALLAIHYPAARTSRPTQGETRMPEAVIVDTVRTPIGRAFKGSLAQLRPDETAAHVVDQLLERNPGVDPALVEDLFCGCGMPQGLQAFNIGRIVS